MKLQRAAELRPLGGHHVYDVDRLERDAKDLMVPESTDIALREVVPVFYEGHDDDSASNYGIVETLEHPDGVAVDASGTRLDLAADANILDLALDASESIQARNSLEKMLAHQLAGAHDAAMKLMARAASDSRMPPQDVVRFYNASARMMDVFTNGYQTLVRVRQGGRQSMVVQHQHVTNQSVQVEDGGQAVVAGSMEGPRR